VSPRTKAPTDAKRIPRNHSRPARRSRRSSTSRRG
jgi:hypothetical protein